MRQLARTLLILGSVTACERAHPVVDHKERPAVGNIGQTGRPAPPPQRPAAIAQPLVDASGSPAVGNIGQTGAPPRRERVRRVQRAQRVPRVEVAPAAAVVVEQPLVNREARPMVGNVMTKGGAPPRPQHAFSEGATSAPVTAATSPLADRPRVDRRERPAVGNMGRRAQLDVTPAELERVEKAIAEAREEAELFPNNREAQAYLASLLRQYKNIRPRVDAR